MRHPIRLAVAAAILLTLTSAPAWADFLITPFLGSTFGGRTNIVNFGTTKPKSTFAVGASGAWLGSGPFGVEADVGLAPRFFEGGGAASVATPHSRILTIVGNLVIAAPLSITRESLRPYAVIGAGMVNASTSDLISLVPVHRTDWVSSVGGGAIGFFDPNVGVRFDVRRFSTMAGNQAIGPAIGGDRLSFWRAAVGVTFRY